MQTAHERADKDLLAQHQAQRCPRAQRRAVHIATTAAVTMAGARSAHMPNIVPQCAAGLSGRLKAGSASMQVGRKRAVHYL